MSDSGLLATVHLELPELVHEYAHVKEINPLPLQQEFVPQHAFGLKS